MCLLYLWPCFWFVFSPGENSGDTGPRSKAFIFIINNNDGNSNNGYHFQSLCYVQGIVYFGGWVIAWTRGSWLLRYWLTVSIWLCLWTLWGQAWLTGLCLFLPWSHMPHIELLLNWINCFVFGGRSLFFLWTFKMSKILNCLPPFLFLFFFFHLYFYLLFIFYISLLIHSSCSPFKLEKWQFKKSSTAARQTAPPVTESGPGPWHVCK